MLLGSHYRFLRKCTLMHLAMRNPTCQFDATAVQPDDSNRIFVLLQNLVGNADQCTAELIWRHDQPARFRIILMSWRHKKTLVIPGPVPGGEGWRSQLSRSALGRRKLRYRVSLPASLD